jgi:3'-5' exoribonuclease
MKIEDIYNMSVGSPINGYFLISNVASKVASNGKTYLIFNLSDKTGNLSMIMWDASSEDINRFKENKVVYIQSTRGEYKGKPQITAINNGNGISIIDNPTDPNSDISLYRKSAPISAKQIQDEINDLILQIKNEVWNRITREFISKHFDDYFNFPAAQKIHEAFPGGLAYHSLMVTKNALAIAKNYPEENIDYSLIITGGLLHDAGKIKELSISDGYEYTNQGSLIGHIIFSDQYVTEIANELGYDSSSEAVVLLRHMILSHQGKLEWNTPILPKTVEAFILSQADNIEAKLQQIFSDYKNIQPGKFSQDYTDTNGENRVRIYRNKL